MSTEVQLITLRQTPERELHAKGELDKYKLPYRVHRFEKITWMEGVHRQSLESV